MPKIDCKNAIYTPFSYPLPFASMLGRVSFSSKNYPLDETIMLKSNMILIFIAVGYLRFKLNTIIY